MAIKIEEKVTFPIQKILGDIATEKGISLRQFTRRCFKKKEHEGEFPTLANLSIHLGGLHNPVFAGRDYVIALEGSNSHIALAYFGNEVERFSNYMKEHGLILVEGRRILVSLNENGNGRIDVEDEKARKAGHCLKGDSFGSNYDQSPKGEYGFMQNVSNSALPGVRDFLKTLVD